MLLFRNPYISYIYTYTSIAVEEFLTNANIHLNNFKPFHIVRGYFHQFTFIEGDSVCSGIRQHGLAMCNLALISDFRKGGFKGRKEDRNTCR